MIIQLFSAANKCPSSAGRVFKMAFAPRCRGASIEIEDDLPRTDGHFGQNALGAADLSTGKIGEAKVAVLDAEDGNVGNRADGDLSEFRVADFGGRDS